MPLARPLLLGALLAAPAAAQPPSGSYVVSSITSPIRAPGGLFLVHPRALPQAPIPVTGLGVDLVGVPGSYSGANCIALRQDDRVLLVGEIGPNGTQIDLHEIELNGTAVARDTTTMVGTVSGSTFGNGINAIALLPGGDALFGVGQLAAQPPLNGELLGRYSRATRTVTPVPLGAVAGNAVHALAVDPAGTRAFVAVAVEGSSSSSIYEVPLLGGGPVRLAGTANAVAALAIDGAGRVIGGGLSPPVFTMDPATGTVTQIGTTTAPVNALSVEGATDLPVYAMNSGGVAWMERNGFSHRLTTGPTGIPTGISIAESLAVYGAPTPGNATYLWRITPAPGGLPLAGSSTFALRVDAVVGPAAAGILLASGGRAALPVFGLRLLLDPATLLVVGGIVPGFAVTVPIAGAVAPGTVLHWQSVHLDPGAPGGLAAANGQTVAVIH